MFGPGICAKSQALLGQFENLLLVTFFISGQSFFKLNLV